MPEPWLHNAGIGWSPADLETLCQYAVPGTGQCIQQRWADLETLCQYAVPRVVAKV